MKIILIGFGEIGQSVYNIFKRKYENVDIVDKKLNEQDTKNLKSKYDLMLVAIPYSQYFIKSIKSYQEKFRPNATVVFSTVAIGTCRKVNAVHSPVEGKHPHLEKSILSVDRWLGGKNKVAIQCFKKLGFKIRVFDKPEITEFLKLRSTSLYGVNIEFARYTKNVCDKLNIDFERVKEFDKWYNELYKKMGYPQYSRYILDAPVGKKGGHCITPNARILNEQFPSALLKEVINN